MGNFRIKKAFENYASLFLRKTNFSYSFQIFRSENTNIRSASCSRLKDCLAGE